MESSSSEAARASSRLFATLGIPPTSDPALLRAAFASAARRHHPDKGGDAGAFAEVSAAYEELTKDATTMPTEAGRGEEGEEGLAVAAAVTTTSLSRHASVARTAAASLASGPPVAAELDLDECERFVEEGEAEEEDGSKREKKTSTFYSHPCRCGAQFVVAEADLRAECCEVLVPCDGCSSKIRVFYRLVEGGVEGKEEGEEEEEGEEGNG